MSHPVLVDINVLLDVLAQRQPHCKHSVDIWVAVYRHTLTGWVSADSLSTLYYFLRKMSTHPEAHRGIQKVCEIFKIVPVDAALIGRALNSPMTDFEDAIQYECALAVNAIAIITRDMRHFQHSSIPALTPANFMRNFDLM